MSSDESAEQSETWGDTDPSPTKNTPDHLFPDHLVSYNLADPEDIGIDVETPDDVLHTAEVYYTHAVEDDLILNPHYPAETHATIVACAAIVAACRKHNAPVHTDELADAADLSAPLILKYYHRLCRSAEIAVMPLSPAAYIDRLEQALQLPSETTRIAHELYEFVEGTYFENGRQPAAIAAGAVYAANVIGPKTITQDQLFAAIPLSDMPVRDAYKGLLESVAEEYGVDPEDVRNTKYASNIARLFGSTTETATEKEPATEYTDEEYNFVCTRCDHLAGTYKKLYFHVALCHDPEHLHDERYRKEACAIPGDVDHQITPDEEAPDCADCDYCDEAFPTALSLELHQARTHPDIEENRGIDDYLNDANYKCTDCNNVYRVYRGLITHLGHMHPDHEIQDRTAYEVNPSEFPVTDRTTEEIIEHNSPVHVIARITEDTSQNTPGNTVIPSHL